tara:strand:- start:4218 stop:5366 length:1149 start_codon:yes stop_codon:yes gene_type:complete
MENSLKIFLIYNATNEILSARIIESLISNGEKKENIIIFVSEAYNLSLLKSYRTIKNPNKKIHYSSKDTSNLNYSTKIKNLFYFIHRKNKILSSFYLRLGTIPIGIEKIYEMNKTFKKDFNNLRKKKICIYTPNIRVHNFQYLLFLFDKFDYHIIEEGKLSFKDKYFWGPFSLKSSFIEKYLDLNILIIFKLIISLKFILAILKKLLKKKSYNLKMIRKYLTSPIFGLNWIFLKNIKPSSVNKISKKAFSNIKFIKQNLYENKSNTEINLIKDLEKNYFSNKFKYYIYALSGNSLEIMKKEFDRNTLLNINLDSLLIRPHPALSNFKIKDIISLINLKLNKKNINISEELRNYPLDIISDLDNYKVIYSNSKWSSVSIYFNN